MLSVCSLLRVRAWVLELFLQRFNNIDISWDTTEFACFLEIHGKTPESFLARKVNNPQLSTVHV